jgi:hypothetical protein
MPVELRPNYPVRSARLLLRPLSVADISALVAYRSIEDVCRYVPFEPMNSEIVADKLAGALSRSAIVAEGDALTLGAELAETGHMIGEVIVFFSTALRIEAAKSAGYSIPVTPVTGMPRGRPMPCSISPSISSACTG